MCFALFLGIVVIWNPLSLSSTPTEDSQAADGPTNTDGWWITEGRYSIEWFNNPDTETYGDGSAEKPYKISTAAQLAGLSWLVYTKGQADNPLVSGTDYSGNYIFQGKFFKQTANIDLSLYYWQPIGIYRTREEAFRENYFSGSYDGGNHTVSGVFTPAGNTAAYSYQGLFGRVCLSNSANAVTIQNLGIIDSFIQGYNDVGGVVGWAEVGSGTITITNCYNTGEVTGSSSYVGGVVGYAYASSDNITITNCYNTGSVSGSQRVGGVVGYANAEFSDSITITNCYNTGSVTSTATSNVYVGGVVGQAYIYTSSTITITNCYNTGNVTSTVTSKEYVGGVVGQAYPYSSSSTITITNCYNTGDVTGSATSNSYVGGVVGNANASSSTITITNCYNTGSVSGDSYVGGVVGEASGTTTITSCYYGANCDLSIGGVNGKDTPGQAEDDPNLTPDTPKTLSWYNDPTNWNTDEYPWDFENVWQINASLNDGYPAFLYQEIPPIDWWTNEGNYSIEWYNNPDTTTYGDGTAENPYKISTAADLAGLSYLVYNNAVEAADATQSQSGNAYYIFSNAYFEQTDNIYLSAHVWQPIGIYYDRSGTQTEHYFSGNYDGGGYTVSGINTPAGDTDAYSYQGLFGYVYRRYSDDPRFIENLGVIDSNIQGYNYVGGVAGCLMGTGVFNSYNSASVSASGNLVGGIAGWARPDGPIEKSYNTGSISGVNYVGGITGEFNDMDGGYMSAVFNRGSVTGTNYVGGISGGTAPLYEAYNTGSVSGSDYVGGILSGSRYNGSDFSGAGGGSTSIIAAFNIGQVISSGTNVDPIIVSVDRLVSQTYYGGSSLSEVAGANGTYIADLDTQAKTLAFLRDTLGLDFATKWQMDTENVNDGYPIFRFDSDIWIGTGNYSTTLLGEGTAQDPYQIWNAEDLAAIAYALQSGEFNGETLTPVVDASMNGANIYFSGVYFEQKADIDLSAHYWEPIGSMLGAMTGGLMTGFGGQYDGGNFEISGLRSLRAYNFAAGEGIGVGLFGMVAGEQTTSEKTAQIKNVHLTDANLSVFMYGGAIAGVSMNARIENCSAAGKYSATITGPANGGMVGMAMMSEIDNCINYCEQTVLMDSDSYYGGIVGASQMSTITNCKNFGDSITVAGGYVGGILGQSTSQDTISNCENYADFIQIEAFDSLRALVFAGIVPEVSGATISGCLNYGTIALQSTIVPSSGAILAGIVGTAESNTTISNCANFGLIDGGSSERAAPAGIVSSLTASQITNSSNFGPVNGSMAAGVVMEASGNCSITGCNNYGTITGDMFASGIVGRAMTDAVNITISDCGSFGRLNAVGQYESFMAGILALYGKNVDVVVSNCAVDITVSATSSYTMAGGIFGVIIAASGADHAVLSADKCSVNVNIFSDQDLPYLNGRVFDAETRFGDSGDVYTLTYTNSYGTVSVNGAIEARALTEDTSAMEGNFVYLTGLNDGRPVPIKTDGSYFFHQHTFGTTTGILDQINEVFYPNLAAQPITVGMTNDFSQIGTVGRVPMSLGLSAGKTYTIAMTIDGTPITTTATSSYTDSSAAPNSAISLDIQYELNGVIYTFRFLSNGVMEYNETSGVIITFSQSQATFIGYATSNGIDLLDPVPVVITAIREVAT